MEIFADENVDFRIFRRLKSEGFSIEHVKNISFGIDDQAVLNLANDHKAILLTEDTDFGQLVYRLRLATYGVAIIRLSGLNLDEKMDRILEAFLNHFDKMKGSFTTIRPNKITIRSLNG